MAFIDAERGRFLAASEDDYGDDQIDKILGDKDKDLVAMPIKNITITPEREQINTQRVRGGMAGSEIRTRPHRNSIEGEMALTGLVSDQDLPEWDPFFRACGWHPEVDPGVGVTYTQKVDQADAMSGYLIRERLDGKQVLQAITGARMDGELMFELDEEVRMSFNGAGLYEQSTKAHEFLDASDSLQVKKDGTTPFTSHDQVVTVEEAVEGYEYVVIIADEDGTEFEFSHEALAADDETDIASALAADIDGSTDVDVDATSTNADIDLTASAVGDRFRARLRRREMRHDANMSLFSKERHASGSIIGANEMTINIAGSAWEVASASIPYALEVEEINTMTGDSGVSRIILTRSLEDNIEINVEVLDANEDVFNEILDRYEDSGFISLDIVAESDDTKFEVHIDHGQIVVPEPSEEGNILGWNLTIAASGDYDNELGGGNDIEIEVTHK